MHILSTWLVFFKTIYALHQKIYFVLNKNKYSTKCGTKTATQNRQKRLH